MADKIGKSIKPFQVLLSNTSKPQVFRSMIAEVVEFFKQNGIDLTQFPITFDSWYGSDKSVFFLQRAFSFLYGCLTPMILEFNE